MSSAVVWIDMQIGMTVDLDALEQEFGPKARSYAFLQDYAKNNYTDLSSYQTEPASIVVNDVSVDLE